MQSARSFGRGFLDDLGKMFERRRLNVLDDKGSDAAAYRKDVLALGAARMPALFVPPFAVERETGDGSDDEDVSDGGFSEASGSSAFSLSQAEAPAPVAPDVEAVGTPSGTPTRSRGDE